MHDRRGHLQTRKCHRGDTSTSAIRIRTCATAGHGVLGRPGRGVLPGTASRIDPKPFTGVPAVDVVGQEGVEHTGGDVFGSYGWHTRSLGRRLGV